MYLIQRYNLQGEEQENAVWDELFLIKVNVCALEELFNQLSSNELIQLKVKTMEQLFLYFWVLFIRRENLFVKEKATKNNI